MSSSHRIIYYDENASVISRQKYFQQYHLYTVDTKEDQVYRALCHTGFNVKTHSEKPPRSNKH